MAGTYKTVGRERLLDFLRHNPDRSLTVDELSAELHRDAPGSGKSSLYRHLSELCDEGTVRKYRDERRAACVYRYVGERDCSHHFHLTCKECGRVIHLECIVSEELLTHIHITHGFNIDRGMSVLYGVCEECEGNEGNARDPFFEKKGSLDSTKKL